jgi:hypothetical protein
VGLDAGEEEHACWCDSIKDRSGLTEILSNIEDRLTDMHGLTIDDNEPERLAGLLTKLAREVEGKSQGCLRKRAQAYLDWHAADPQPWPPPAAIDWLLVDLGSTPFVDAPVISVPEFTSAPGERGVVLHLDSARPRREEIPRSHRPENQYDI